MSHTSGIRDALTDIVTAHERKDGIRKGSIHCTCEWSRSILGMTSSKGAFREHLVDALIIQVETQIEEAVRKELRDAAAALDLRALERSSSPLEPLDYDSSMDYHEAIAVEFLQARAEVQP